MDCSQVPNACWATTSQIPAVLPLHIGLLGKIQADTTQTERPQPEEHQEVATPEGHLEVATQGYAYNDLDLHIFLRHWFLSYNLCFAK